LAPLEGLGDFVENAHVCISWSIWEVQATSPEPGLGKPEHDAIPGKFGLPNPKVSGMTQLRSVFTFSEVKNA
jgi:hypothetical protein